MPNGSDWVVLGVVGAPFGLEGWVYVQSFSESPESLREYSTWWLRQGGYEIPLTLESTAVHSGRLIAKWLGCESRDKAVAYRGAEVVVPRSALPPLEDGSYYWADLEGCEVVDRNRHEVLGCVDYLYESAQDIMVVRHPERGESHIPFLLDDVVLEVDLASKRIWVDWPLLSGD